MIKDIETAKRNVLWLIDHPDGLVDMHGLVYWAGRVESIRAAFRAL